MVPISVAMNTRLIHLRSSSAKFLLTREARENNERKMKKMNRTIRKSITAVFAAGTLAAVAADCDVGAFGAKGDGETDSTAAIQRAIDSCAASGGGTVTFPKGWYVTYTLFPKSNVDIRIDEGVTLFAGTDLAKWKDVEDLDHYTKRFIFYANGQTNVTISGRGTVNGNADHFYFCEANNWKRHDDRLIPRKVFVFVKCRDIAVRDITVRNNSGWSMWIANCDNVHVDGYKVRADRRYPNGDGIHISSSRDIVVENCDVSSLDDALVVRSPQLEGLDVRPCENVMVRNCTLDSFCTAWMRIGWRGDWAIRNVTVRNVISHHSLMGWSLWVPPFMGTEESQGRMNWDGLRPLQVENFLMENVNVKSSGSCVGIQADKASIDYIRNITFRNCVFRSEQGPGWEVRGPYGMSDMTFDHVDFDVRRKPHKDGWNWAELAVKNLRWKDVTYSEMESPDWIGWGRRIDGVTFTGRTDRDDPVSYGVGEPIAFTFDLSGYDGSKDGLFVEWKRSGDDMISNGGKVPLSELPLTVKSSSNRPGFVRFEAWLVDENGTVVKGKRDGFTYYEGGSALQPIEFCGTAGVAVGQIAGADDEPADFDAFWLRMKARLAACPVKELSRSEVPSCEAGTRIYGVEVASPTEQPVRGYLTIPGRLTDAGKKVPLYVLYEGYGCYENTNPGVSHNSMSNCVTFRVNAHGAPLGLSRGEYEKFYASYKKDEEGYKYGFNPAKNANPETSYFLQMALRDLRAIEYLKTIPEWDGKNLIVCGGSQGGWQTFWVAAHAPGVTEAWISISWGCDQKGFSLGRLEGMKPLYVDALGYFDTVNHAKRIPKTVFVDLPRVGLGDWTCPPSGITAAYNAIPGERKRVHYIQGSTHSWIPVVDKQEIVKSGALK